MSSLIFRAVLQSRRLERRLAVLILERRIRDLDAVHRDAFRTAPAISHMAARQLTALDGALRIFEEEAL